MELVNESTSIKAAVELKNMAAYGVRGEPKVVEATEPEGNDLVEIELTRLEADTSSEEEDEEEESDGEAKPLWKRLVRKVNKRRKRGKAKGRETWDNKVQFILTLIGYAVGLGNVWRFSYLCAKNGGGAFIIPYMIMLFLLGIPLFYLELLLGQSVRKGPIGAWMKLIPNLAGIGMAAVVVIVYICIYYNVIISWVLFYFVNSFHDPLPWAKCFGYEVHGHNLTKVMIETTVDNFTLARCWNESTEFYWYETALQASDHIGAAERFNWQMFLSLLAAWILIYLCLFKGIQSSGKYSPKAQSREAAEKGCNHIKRLNDLIKEM